MKRPVSMKRVRSTPVSMPMPPSRPRPRSRRCRSPRAHRGRRGIDDGDPEPEAGQDVGQCLAAGVVEVHGDTPERDAVSGRLDHAAGGERRPCPDGVAERDLLAAQLVQSSGERGHPFGGARPFVRTAEHTGDRPAPAGRRPARGRRATAGSGSDHPAGRATLPPGKAARLRFGMTAASFRGDK
jgi:hypothetical protein